MTIYEDAKRYNDYIISMRRYFHENPELSGKEINTMKVIGEELSKIGIDYVEVENGGILAKITGPKPGRTVLLRADCDALPVQEKEVNLSCKRTCVSKNPGVMHACGHDGHMAMALGLARHIAANLDKLERSVLIVFQPAEETTGGAQFICESGVFEKYHVDRIFGFHLWPDLPKGQIASRPGALLAATSESTFTFFGKATHIAKAEDGADSMEAGMRFILEAYDYMAKRAQEEPCTFKCGLLESGQARNVISSRTYIEGTLRTFSEKMGAEAKAALREIAERRAAEAGCTVDVDFSEGYPPVVNNEELFELASRHVDVTELPKPLLIAEDFAFYQRHLPGVFLLLGTGTGIPLHADTFNFDEEVLMAGLETYKKLIRIP